MTDTITPDITQPIENPTPEAQSEPTQETSYRLHIGAAYYPEQWPEERWEEDIRLMQNANLSVMRMAEFAWSTLEPVEGEFHFDWLDRAIELLASHQIKTVLGTPTAAPPAWLTQKYPKTLAVDEYGRRVQHGNRCHYCVTSTQYHTAVRRIVKSMAERFGQNPMVIGWQIDNEFSRVCYCDRCQTQFQKFLAEKYSSLENLNQRWSTAYWSQTYSDWKQIPLPIGDHNPGLMLEFKRFTTSNYRHFQKIQLDELRPHLPEGVWVTHNFMGWFDGFDHYELSEDLDMVSWDDYVGSGHHDYRAHSATHSLTRGFKRQNYWVMETQPGHVNWSKINNFLNKGEARAMAWQGVAHGADGILYWQWRSALGGQEQYHGTLVDQSGETRPFYTEVQHLGDEFSRISELLADSAPKARVAILNDYESRWAIQWQKHHADFDYVVHMNQYYRAFALRNIPVDIISARMLKDVNQLKSYKLVIAPALNIISEQLAAVLKDFSRNNHLVLTLRSGMKDEYNALLPMRQPGLLAEIAGVEVLEYFALERMVPIKGSIFEGYVQQWAETLKINGQYALGMGKYKESNGWLDGQVALTVSGQLGGMGLVYYVGASLDDASQQKLVDRLLLNAHIKPLNTPTDVEVRTRVKPDGTEIYFIINHAQRETTIWLPWLAKDHLSETIIEDELKLGPYGVAVVTREELQEEEEI